MKAENKFITGVCGLIVAFAWLFFMNNKSDSEFRIKKQNIEIDSIKRNIILPTTNNIIEFNKPMVIKSKEFIYLENPTDDKLKKLIKELEVELGEKVDSIHILKKLYTQSLVRDYRDKYEDSLISITSRSKVKGYLLNNKIDYTLKERQIEHHDKYITKTIYVNDSFTLYGGATYASDKLYGTISLRDKKRTVYGLGYAGKDNWLFEFKFPIFQK